MDKAVLKRIPETPGVYLFADSAKTVLYVGKAINLKRRVASYFADGLLAPKTSHMMGDAARILTIQTDSEFDALLLEAKLIKKYKTRYNVSARDDKHPLYIKITRELFPKIATVRREDDKKSAYFGPFPSTAIVRQTLRFLRRAIPFCTERRVGKKHCFYAHIGLCDPCPNEISQLPEPQKTQAMKQYRHQLSLLKRILEGKSAAVKKQLERTMMRLARQEQFREAARVKRQLDRLTYITTPRIPVSEYLKNPNLYDDLRQEEGSELARLIGIERARRIEGYDISNLQGTNPTASMVVFSDGEPDKRAYRRFRIRTKETPDDFKMMQEVLKRRFKHEEWEIPDVILIDGGIPQLRAAHEALFTVLQHHSIPIIGLAKEREELIIPVYPGANNRERTAGSVTRHRLLPGSPALRLAQRIRDEAHRFARAYHLKLRTKKMLYYD